MSAQNVPLSNYKYQTSTLKTHSYNPKVINVYSTSTLKTSQYSQKKPNLISLYGNDTNLNLQNSLNIMSMNYSYQDESPDVNVIFFDSNLRKYRTDSFGLKQNISKSVSNSMEKIKYTSKTLGKSFNSSNNYKPNRTLNYSQNQNAATYKRGENILSTSNAGISQKGKINTFTISSYGGDKNGRISSMQNKSSSLGRINHNQNITSSKSNKSSYGIPMPNQKVIISQNKSSYSRINQNQNISSSSQNKSLTGNINQNKTMTYSVDARGNQNERNKYESKRLNTTETNINNRNKNQRNERLDILKSAENKEQKYKSNNISQYQNKKIDEVKSHAPSNLRDAKNIISNEKLNIRAKETQATLANSQETNLRNAKNISNEKEKSNLKDSKFSTNSKDNTNLRKTKEILSNSKQSLSFRKAKTVMEAGRQDFNSRETKTKLSYGKETNIREEKPSNVYNREKKNENIREEKNIYSSTKENQQLKDSRISQRGKDSNKQNYEKEPKDKRFSNRVQQQRDYNERNIMDEEEDKNQNVEIVNKHEEKTIVVLPGQTIEPKTITETFRNPVVETIENEDGTTSSIIKQTKITTISENVPIGNNKVKSIDGAPELPMVKQYITYEYKTVTSLKESKVGATKFLEPKNKKFEEDYRDDYARQNIEKNQLENNEEEEKSEYNLLKNEEMNEENIGENKEEENANEEMNENEDEDEIQLYGKKQGKNLKSGKKEAENKIVEGRKNKTGKIEENKNKEERPKSNQKSNNKSGKSEDIQENRLKQDGEAKKRQKSGMKSGKKEINKNEFEVKTNQKSGVKSGPKEFSKKEFEEKNIQKSLKNAEKVGLKEGAKGSKRKPFLNEEHIEGSSGNKKIGFSGKSGKLIEKDSNIEKKEKKQDDLKENKKAGKSKGKKDMTQKSLDNEKDSKLRSGSASVEKNLKGSINKLSEAQKSKEEKIIEEIIKKGDSASSEEKQKRFKFLSELYSKCCQGSKSDLGKNLEKLGGYLLLFVEKDRKDILLKLYNFIKNDEIYQKLLSFASKKYSFKSKSKKEGKKESSSQNKDYNFGFENEKGKMSLKNSKNKEAGNGIDNKFNQKLIFDWDYKNSVLKEKSVDLNMKMINPKLYEQVEVKDIAPLKFDGLFLEISKYDSGPREKNPFEGPSPFNKFYKERKTKIKQKIIVKPKEENEEQEK